MHELIREKEENSEDDSEKQYVIDKIKLTNAEGKYLVSWKGYGSSDDTWERFTNLCHTEAFEKFQVPLIFYSKSSETAEGSRARVKQHGQTNHQK